MQIKTLAEILADTDTVSASSVRSKGKRVTETTTKPTRTELFNRRKTKKHQRLDKVNNINTQSFYRSDNDDTLTIDENFFTDSSSLAKLKKKTKKKKRFHPAANFVAEPSDTTIYELPETQTIKQILTEVKNNVHDSQDNQQTSFDTDNLPSALKAYLRSPEQKQAELDIIKEESRLRWLAFYYLSRREHGRAELRQKLIDKEQDPEKIDALLDEFVEKGYQSDYRTTLMLIRENIRKGRGRGRIKQEFYKKKIAMPRNIDELIDMANSESDEFSEFVDEDADSLVEGVDWLKLAVAARTKKYGDDIPTEQKDKAKQLRFLQYRGFKGEVCFDALNYTLDTLHERF
jgi:regulatory protein